MSNKYLQIINPNNKKDEEIIAEIFLNFQQFKYLIESFEANH